MFSWFNIFCRSAKFNNLLNFAKPKLWFFCHWSSLSKFWLKYFWHKWYIFISLNIIFLLEFYINWIPCSEHLRKLFWKWQKIIPSTKTLHSRIANMAFSSTFWGLFIQGKSNFHPTTRWLFARGRSLWMIICNHK